jgi:hypothetical protein
LVDSVALVVGRMFRRFRIYRLMVWKRPRMQMQPFRSVRYIMQPTTVARTTSVKAVEPVIESSFWRHETEQDHSATADDKLCSVCLCSVEHTRRPMSSIPDIGSGQAACCNSWFHRYCVLQYWQSNDGNVICPNCRYERSHTVDAI